MGHEEIVCSFDSLGQFRCKETWRQRDRTSAKWAKNISVSDAWCRAAVLGLAVQILTVIRMLLGESRGAALWCVMIAHVRICTVAASYGRHYFSEEEACAVKLLQRDHIRPRHELS